MKIASYQHSNCSGYGTVQGQGIIPASQAFRQRYPSLRHVLEAEALSELARDAQNRSAELSFNDITFLPPIPNCQRIFCAGMNYPKRYPVAGDPPPPDNVVLFAKVAGTLVGHEQALEIPLGEAANTFDYEGEIVVIIGKGGRHIRREDAHKHIAGYTAMNDGSVRAWQKHSIHAGKNFANSGSCGPWMLTSDEVSDTQTLDLSVRLNGTTVQESSAERMFFSIAKLIAYTSHTIDLRPGDMIATGSPEGTGASQTPPRFLRSGDVIEVEVSRLGVLRNQVA